jgi:hypothetical protein
MATPKTLSSRPKLPRTRPCVDCGEEAVIVSNGRCNKCHLRLQRKQAAMNPTPAMRHQKGMKILTALEKVMDELKLFADERETYLRIAAPHLGLNPDTSVVEYMTGPDIEKRESAFARVHPGSSETPPDNEVRKPEPEPEELATEPEPQPWEEEVGWTAERGWKK